MAINKQKASPVVKVGIIVVSLLLVLSFTLPLLGGNLFSGSSNNSSSTSGTSGKLDSIAAKYTGSITGYEQQLASEPTSYTVLVNLANTYYDWGSEIRQANITDGSDKPMWLAAVTYYDRALEAKPGDPSVTTDAAISHYYAGDLAKAIVLVEPIMKSDPTFAPAFFNAAIFYDSAGDTAKATAAANTYLKLDPNGQSGSPTYAKSIADKGSAVSTSTP